MLKGIEGGGIAEIFALSGSVLGQILEVESTFSIRQKLNRGALATLCKGIN